MPKVKDDKRILDWSDERSMGNPIMVTLAYGWAFDPSEDHNSASHVRGFDNAKEVKRELRWVKPCHCLRCTSKGKEA